MLAHVVPVQTTPTSLEPDIKYNFSQQKEIKVFSAITLCRGVIPEKTWIFCSTGVRTSSVCKIRSQNTELCPLQTFGHYSMWCKFNETNLSVCIVPGGVSPCVQDPVPDPAESSLHLHTLVSFIIH